MSRFLASLAVATCLSAGPVSGEDKIFSGPQPGEPLSPFDVLQVRGSNEAKETQLAKERANSMIVFLHKINEPALGLMITLEWYLHTQEKVRPHFVILTDDVPKTERMVKRWWRNPFFAKAPMNISVDGTDGPGRYGLNRNVMMTVLIAKQGKVAANYALTSASDTNAPDIIAGLSKSLGLPNRSMADIRKELAQERKRRRERRRRNNPIYKLAPNEDVGRLMLSVVFTEGDRAAQTKRAVEQLNKWAGEDKARQATLKTYANKLLNAKIDLNQYARDALKSLAGRKE